MRRSRLQQYNSIKTSSHCCLAKVAFDYFVLLYISQFQGLITQSKVLGFIVIIESSKALSINIGQQGINRNNKEYIYGKFTHLFSSVTHHIYTCRQQHFLSA